MVIIEKLSTPFCLGDNLVWFIENFTPIIVILIGWIVIYRLNKKNILTDKIISSRIQAYNEIQVSICNLATVIQNFDLYISERIFFVESISKAKLKNNLASNNS